jgi:hypothetical protein
MFKKKKNGLPLGDRSNAKVAYFFELYANQAIFHLLPGTLENPGKRHLFLCSFLTVF